MYLDCYPGCQCLRPLYMLYIQGGGGSGGGSDAGSAAGSAPGSPMGSAPGSPQSGSGSGSPAGSPRSSINSPRSTPRRHGRTTALIDMDDYDSEEDEDYNNVPRKKKKGVSGFILDEAGMYTYLIYIKLKKLAKYKNNSNHIIEMSFETFIRRYIFP